MNLGNVAYTGPIQDLDGKDENFYNNDVVISDQLKDLIRNSMRRFYGDQVDQWNIGFKMVQVYQQWIGKVSDGCDCFKFVPKPLSTPILSGSSLIMYLLKYSKQIIEDDQSQANYACMLSAAAGMKTEFWEAGNL